MSSLVGKTLGQYQLLEQIGQGSFAAVYKAYDPSASRYVAIKVFPAIHPNDLPLIKRFERNMPLIVKLHHPQVLPIYDFGAQDQMPYVVMEYISGGTLAERLKSNQPLPLSETIKLILQACQALEYIHQQSIVHRDVKPSNILLRNEDVLLLSDCCISSMLAARGDEDQSNFPFRPEYVAPEQLGDFRIDRRSDLYSLGIVLYQVVTGRVPFGSPGDNPVAILVKHIKEPPPLPSQFVAGLPPKVEQVMMKALEKDPAKRYQSATEVIAALTTI